MRGLEASVIRRALLRGETSYRVRSLPESFALEWERVESASPLWAERLLAASLEVVGEAVPAEWSTWPIPDRNLALLDVYRRQFGETAHVVACCPQETCASQLDVDFEIDELAELGRDASMQVEWQGETVRLKVPTGEQLRAWQPESPDFVQQVAEFMLGSAVSEEQLAELAPRLLTALAGPRFELPVDCSLCGTPFAVAIELPMLFQSRMAQWMEDLEHEVHVLASQYHWSEQEILSLPSHRRKRYVQRLGETWS